MNVANINVKEKWWTDGCRETLVLLAGNFFLADGLALHLWRFSFICKLDGVPLTKERLLQKFTDENLKILLQSKVLIEKGDEYLVRGSEEAFSWIEERRLQASEAGKKSAEVRKQKYGTALPINATNFELPPNDRSDSSSSQPNETEPNNNKYNNTNINICAVSVSQHEFEDLYQQYPKRQKGNMGKATGMKRCAVKFKSRESFEALKKAVQEISRQVKSGELDRKFIPMWSTFVNSYEDWLPENNDASERRESPFATF